MLIVKGITVKQILNDRKLFCICLAQSKFHNQRMKSVVDKLLFRDGLVCTVGLIVEIDMAFLNSSRMLPHLGRKH